MTASTATGFEHDKICVQPIDSGEGLYLLSRSTKTAWLTSAISAIRKLKDLRSGWDSYGANPIDGESIEGAIELVRELARVAGIQSPQISATPSGHVALLWTWRQNSRELELVVLPQGEFQYCYSDNADLSRDQCGVTKYPTQIAVMLTKA